MKRAERVAEIRREWRLDPVKFVRDVFKAEPDEWQADALRAFADPSIKRISMQACVGPGKSALLAWCGWNFLFCYGEPGQHPKGAAVSVTADNLKDNLWPEYAKWQSRSALLTREFQWTKERIFSKTHDKTWFMSARSFSKTADPEEQGRTLSGLHSEYVLAQIDESGEVPPAVARAAEQALSTHVKFGKIMQAGNPTSHDGMLYAAATTQRDMWHVIRITSDPDDPKRTPRVAVEWAAEQIKLYGRDNPWVMSSILGQFPPSSINALLGPDEVNKALGKHLARGVYEYAEKRLGVDVARFGDDRTMIAPRQGRAAFKMVEMRSARTNEIAARVAQAKMKWGSEREFVDGSGGYGAGVIDSLSQAGYSPVEVQFGGKAIDPRYFNKRSEMWFLMAEWVKTGGALPNDPQLAKELLAPTYTFQGGKLRLEEKDQIKKRLGFSPDKADALALTFGLPDSPSLARMGLHERLLNQERMQTARDYDPFSDDRMLVK